MDEQLKDWAKDMAKSELPKKQDGQPGGQPYRAKATPLPRPIMIALAVLVGLAFLLLACDSGSSTPVPTAPTIGTPKAQQNFNNGEIKIGVAAPLSGDTADGGIQIAQGVLLAAQEVNDNGGLLGKKIVVVQKDDKANADAGKLAATELVHEKVVAVIGHKDSGVSAAAAPIYKAAGLLQISPTSSRPDLTAQGLDNFLRTCPNDAYQGPVIADYVVNKLGKKKIAIVNGNTAYGQGLRQYYEQKLSALGVKPLIAIEVQRGGLDFTDALKQVKATNPEVLLYAGSIPEAIILTQQMHDQAAPDTLMPDVEFVAGDTVFQRDYIKSTGKASEGAIVSSFFTDTTKVDSLRPWVNNYRALFQRDPGGNSAGGYAAAQVIFAAIKQANSDDPAQVKAAAKAVQLGDSIVGPISFNAQGDLADPSAHLHLFKVQGGQFVPADK